MEGSGGSRKKKIEEGWRGASTDTRDGIEHWGATEGRKKNDAHDKGREGDRGVADPTTAVTLPSLLGNAYPDTKTISKGLSRLCTLEYYA